VPVLGGPNPPASLALHRDWFFTQGANAQAVYDFGPLLSNGVRGSTTGADTTQDFTWNAGGWAAFDGTSDYGTATTTLLGANNSFTLMALIRLTTGIDRKAVTIGSATGASLNSIGLGSSGSNVRVVIFGGDIITTHPLGTGWKLLTFRFAARNVTGYAGITEIANTTLGADLALPANPIVHFGKPTWTLAEYWGGDVARVLLYNAQLTVAQLTEEVNRVSIEMRERGFTSADFI